MTIKQQGGIFGRNPTFNDVNVEGNLGVSVDDPVAKLQSDAEDNFTTGDQSSGTSLYLSSINGSSAAGTYGPALIFGKAGTSNFSPRAGITSYTKSTEGDDDRVSLAFWVHNSGSGSAPLDHYFTMDRLGDFTIETGNLVIGTSGQGIDFSATSGTGTSELFDDYEEGTWTPTLTTDGTDFDSVTYDGATAGAYTKIGNCVTCSGRLRTDAVTVGSGTGNVCIGGLPFTANSDADTRTAINVGDVSAWGGDMPIGGRIDAGSTKFLLTYRTAVNGATSFIQTSDVGTGANANNIYFSLFYYV